MDSMRRTADELDKSVDRLDRNFGSLNKSITQFRIIGSFIAAVFIATRVANNALIKTITEFETSLVTLKAVAIDSTKALASQAEEFRNLEDAARTIGKTTQFSAVEAAEGLVTLAKAGLSAQEAINTLPSVLNLAQSQLISVEQASESVVNVLRQFQISSFDASRVVDILSETANRTSADVQLLASSLKFVGPISAALGQDLEQVAAALGVLANSGLQGSLSGTTLRGVLTALTGPTKQAQKAINALGLEISDLNPATNSIEDIVGKLSSTFLGTTEAVDIFNRRNAATALILTNNLGPLKELIKQEEEARLRTVTLARAQDDTLAGSFKRLRAIYQENILQLESVKKGLRETTETIIDVLKIFAGVKDPLVEANDAAQTLATSLKLVASAAATLIAANLIGYFIKLGGAIAAAEGIVAKLIYVLSINPFAAFAAGLAVTIGSIALYRNAVGELINVQEEANKIGNPKDSDRYASLIAQLDKVNSGLKNAVNADKDFNEALSLTNAKQSLIKSEVANIRFLIQEDPNNASILLDQANKLIEQVRSKADALEIEIKIQDQAKSRVKEDFSRLLRESLENPLTSQNLLTSRSVLVGKFDDFIKDILGSDELKGRFFLEPSAFDPILKQTNDFIDKIKALAPEKGVIEGFFTGGSEKFIEGLKLPEGQRLFKEFVDSISDQAVRAGEIVKVDLKDAFGSTGEVLTSALKELGDESKKFADITKESFKSIIAQNDLTEEDIANFVKMGEARAKASEEVDKLTESIIKEQNVLRASIDLSDEEAERKKKQLQAIDSVNEARKQSLALLQRDIDRAQVVVNAAIKDPAGAIESGTTLERAIGTLNRYKQKQGELNREYDAQVAFVIRLLDETNRLEDLRKQSVDSSKREQELNKSLENTILSLSAESDALEARIDKLQANSSAERQLVGIKADFDALVRQFVGTQDLENKSLEEKLALVERLTVKLNEQKEKESILNLQRKQNIRDGREEAEAIKKLVRDLDTELELVGKTATEKETLNRIRRINSSLISSENQDEIKAGEALKSRLEESVEITVKALDQRKKAEELGRNVARAFTEPLRDVLKGGDLKSAARSLLEGLFDIFLNTFIFDPLEEQLSRLFEKSKSAQKLVAAPTGSFVDDKQVDEAKLNITNEALSILTSAEKLKEASEKGIDFSEGLSVAVANFRAVIDKLNKTTPPASGRIQIPGPSKPPGSESIEQVNRESVTEARAPLSLSNLERQANTLVPNSISLVGRPETTSDSISKVIEPPVLRAIEKAAAFPSTEKTFQRPPRRDFDPSRLSTPPFNPNFKGGLNGKPSDISFPETFVDVPFFGSLPLPQPSKTKADAIAKQIRARLDAQKQAVANKAVDTSKVSAGLLEKKDSVLGKLPPSFSTIGITPPKSTEQLLKELKSSKDNKTTFGSSGSLLNSTTLNLTDKQVEKQITRLEKISEENKSTFGSTNSLLNSTTLNLTDKEVSQELKKLEKISEENKSTFSSVDSLFNSSTSNLTDKQVREQLFSKTKDLTDAQVEQELKRLEKISEENKTTFGSVEDLFNGKTRNLTDKQVEQELKRLETNAQENKSTFGSSNDLFNGSTSNLTDKQIEQQLKEIEISSRSISEIEDAVRRGVELGLGGLEKQASPVKTSITPPSISTGTSIQKTVSDISFAAAQVASAFGPLPATSANLSQAASSLAQATSGLLGASTSEASLSPTPLSTGGGAGSETSFSNELFKGFGGQISGFLNGLFSKKLGFQIPALFAKGGAFDSGEQSIVKAFASGSEFTNKIVDKPTLFNLGLMGEKGPEGILPLKRDKNGLGVSGFIAGKEAANLKLTRGQDGRLGVDLKSLEPSAFALGGVSEKVGSIAQKASAFAVGAPIERGVVLNTFADGGIINEPRRSLGIINAPSEITQAGSNPSINNSKTEIDNSVTKPVTVNFHSQYIFPAGTSPDASFKKARRQHEQDLRDKTRRVF